MTDKIKNKKPTTKRSKKIVKLPEPKHLLLRYDTSTEYDAVCEGQEELAWPSYEDVPFAP